MDYRLVPDYSDCSEVETHERDSEGLIFRLEHQQRWKECQVDTQTRQECQDTVADPGHDAGWEALNVSL